MTVKQVRQSAVAGTFYPSSQNVLTKSILTHIKRAQSHPVIPKALIAPHAGIIYSGDIAGSAYKLIFQQKTNISRVILLGPSHHFAFDGLALPQVDIFSTPLGDITLDRTLFESLLKFSQVQSINQAHQPEHSLELQLPFLQASLSEFKIIPLLAGKTTPSQIAEVLQFLWGGAETLIVISSDLSHYHPYDQARSYDAATVAAIEQFSTTLTGDQACGYNPINGLLQLANEKNMQIKTLDVRNSGDTAGDKTRVVGYGAFALY